MPYDDPDPQDPTMLVGVEVAAGPEADLEMAYSFAEEFARLGFDERRLLSLFRHPFFAGAYRVLHSLGEEKIKSIVRETLEVWGRVRFTDCDVPQGPDVELESLRPTEEEPVERKRGQR